MPQVQSEHLPKLFRIQNYTLEIQVYSHTDLRRGFCRARTMHTSKEKNKKCHPTLSPLVSQIYPNSAKKAYMGTEIETQPKPATF